MITKMLEIRDRGTCIAAMAIKMAPTNDIERTYLRREGFPSDGHGVVLMRLADQRATSDPYEWPSLTRDTRTMPHAHLLIIAHWNEIEPGQVIDVRVVLGEATEPATAEIGVHA